MERRKEVKPRSTRKMPVDGKMQCTKCKEWKEINCFSPNLRRPCGVSCHCRSCQAEYARRRYAVDPEPHKIRSKLWNQMRPDNLKIRQAKCYRGNPNRQKASVAVSRAVKFQQLDRLHCAICGKEETEAHHFSYEKEHWLHVIWLCRKHHREAHRGLWPQIRIPE